MAAKKAGFWQIVTLSVIAFLVCVVIIILGARLVDSLANGYPNLSEEASAAATAPAGRIYYRGE
ncbi:MAG: hypothetical protein ISN26_07475 [Betaproteobacteria bacterium AqS2]|uniref:Uncharacterized protein n=1 Tax=Candidatus Amphirhobacter heronislandensis TaxID=1732024 RepID=A0A930UDH7_9GAMM|nr:hypothetical protein [Betaproteobacteria bacterium AqS2]